MVYARELPFRSCQSAYGLLSAHWESTIQVVGIPMFCIKTVDSFLPSTHEHLNFIYRLHQSIILQ